MGTVELEAFLPRVRSRWGLPLDASNTAGCKAALQDLIARNIERLEAKREAHLEHADESQASTAARLAYEESPQGERLRRYVLACERRTHRCRDAFWKHRREMGRAEDAGRRSEDRTDDGGRTVVVGADGGEYVIDLRSGSGVGEALANGPEKNLTSEPNRGSTASETAGNKEIAALSEVTAIGLGVLSKMRDLGIETSATAFGGDEKGLHAIEASILRAGRCCRQFPDAICLLDIPVSRTHGPGVGRAIGVRSDESTREIAEGTDGTEDRDAAGNWRRVRPPLAVAGCKVVSAQGVALSAGPELDAVGYRLAGRAWYS